jgi:hypothetical protein
MRGCVRPSHGGSRCDRVLARAVNRRPAPGAAEWRDKVCTRLKLAAPTSSAGRARAITGSRNVPGRARGRRSAEDRANLRGARRRGAVSCRPKDVPAPLYGVVVDRHSIRGKSTAKRQITREPAIRSICRARAWRRAGAARAGIKTSFDRIPQSTATGSLASAGPPHDGERHPDGDEVLRRRCYRPARDEPAQRVALEAGDGRSCLAASGTASRSSRRPRSCARCPAAARLDCVAAAARWAAVATSAA